MLPDSLHGHRSNTLPKSKQNEKWSKTDCGFLQNRHSLPTVWLCYSYLIQWSSTKRLIEEGQGTMQEASKNGKKSRRGHWREGSEFTRAKNTGENRGKNRGEGEGQKVQRKWLCQGISSSNPGGKREQQMREPVHPNERCERGVHLVANDGDRRVWGGFKEGSKQRGRETGSRIRGDGGGKTRGHCFGFPVGCSNGGFFVWSISLFFFFLLLSSSFPSFFFIPINAFCCPSIFFIFISSEFSMTF